MVKHKILKLLCFTFIIAFFDVLLLERLYDHTIDIKPIPLSALEKVVPVEKIASFQIPNKAIEEIKRYCETERKDFIQFFSAYMAYNDFQLKDVSYDFNQPYYDEVKYPAAIEKIYEMLLKDVVCFPIPQDSNKNTNAYYFNNSWKAQRTYGGDRPHYGTDIMDAENENGRIPIVSMTNGYIEKIGWLELGGWRIGIRAEHGGYFYYAHMDRYADHMFEGKAIKAGDVIGYMGDTGYGEEGTRGQFPVHLHLGIALPANEALEEFWINPYWLLSYIEEAKVTMHE